MAKSSRPARNAKARRAKKTGARRKKSATKTAARSTKRSARKMSKKTKPVKVKNLASGKRAGAARRFRIVNVRANVAGLPSTP